MIVKCGLFGWLNCPSSLSDQLKRNYSIGIATLVQSPTMEQTVSKNKLEKNEKAQKTREHSLLGKSITSMAGLQFYKNLLNRFTSL